MKKLKKDMLYVILTALGIVMIFPFFWMISCAFRRPNELLTSPPRLLPASPIIIAVSVAWPFPVSDNEPYRSTDMRVVRDKLPLLTS